MILIKERESDSTDSLTGDYKKVEIVEKYNHHEDCFIDDTTSLEWNVGDEVCYQSVME